MAERVKLAEKGLPDLEPLAEAGEWLQKYPKLTGYLIDCAFTDGSPREPSKLFIAVMRGKWCVTLKEPNQGLQLEVVTDLPTDVFAALEAALSAERPPWRHDPWASRKRKSTGR